MRRIYQTTGADRSQNGNCFQACIASYLGLSLSEVPNFHGETGNGKLLPVAVRKSMDDWLAARGLGYIEIAYQDRPSWSLSDFLHQLEDFGSNFYLLTGRTKLSKIHTVVCRGGAVAHDPATSVGHTVIAGPCHDGYYRIGVFLSLSTAT